MKQKELSALTDQELLKKAKERQSSPILDAFFIGFLIGIVVYSAMVNSWGFFTLIPLYLAYVLIKKANKDKSLDKELQDRNLK